MDTEVAGRRLRVTLATDSAALAEAVSFCRRAPLVGVDVETTGLDHGDRLRLVQLAVEDRVWVVDCWQAGVGPPGSLLADPEVRKAFHNASFDLRFLAAAGLDVSQVRLFDAMLASQTAARLPRRSILWRPWRECTWG